MDFKIEDDYGKGGGLSSGDSKMKIIIIAVVSIVIGLTVFFIVNHFFGTKTTEVPAPEQVDVSLTDENVQILYQYVSFGTKGIRNDKFVREKMVNLSSFSNEEKYYYALQFADSDDFEFTGDYTEKKKKIYGFSLNRMKEYMVRYFGPEVSFSTEGTYSHPFSFTINGQNIGFLSYSNENDEYKVYFDGFQDLDKKEGEDSSDDEDNDATTTDVETGEETKTTNKVYVDPFYTKLVSATKLKDNTLILKEKVVYVKEESNGGNYTLYITRDFDNNNLIETKPNLSEAELQTMNIDINNYIDSAATVTYTFKVNDGVYYFYSSEITQ